MRSPNNYDELKQTHQKVAEQELVAGVEPTVAPPMEQTPANPIDAWEAKEQANNERLQAEVDAGRITRSEMVYEQRKFDNAELVALNAQQSLDAQEQARSGRTEQADAQGREPEREEPPRDSEPEIDQAARYLTVAERWQQVREEELESARDDDREPTHDPAQERAEGATETRAQVEEHDKRQQADRAAETGTPTAERESGSVEMTDKAQERAARVQRYLEQMNESERQHGNEGRDQSEGRTRGGLGD